MASDVHSYASRQHRDAVSALARPGVEMLKVSTKSSRRVKNRRVWLETASAGGTSDDELIDRLGGVLQAGSGSAVRLCWEKSSSRPLGPKHASVPLSAVKDVRFGTAGSPYRTALHLSPDVEPRWMTVIYHVPPTTGPGTLLGSAGAQYKLVHFIAPDEPVAGLWRKAFEAARGNLGSAEALAIDQGTATAPSHDCDDKVVKEDDVVKLCARLGMGLARDQIAKAFRETAAPNDSLDFAAFQKFVKVLKRRTDVEAIFARLGGPFSFATLTDFLTSIQKSTISKERAEALFIKYRDELTGTVLVDGFSAYLLSSENAPMRDEPVDMSRPLVEYYINSSHNTYLVGGQLQGESTVEGYIRALQQGCRCVELDVWGGEERPIITHGRTLTTSIPVDDALKAINAYAFLASPYPVILSFEVHCDTPQQDILAESLVSILGDQLVSTRLDTDCQDEIDCLPSPSELKGRILLKAKNLFITSPDGLNTPTQRDLIETTSESSSDNDFKKVFANVKNRLDRRSSSSSAVPTTASRQSSTGSTTSVSTASTTTASIQNARTPKPPMSAALARLIVYTVGVKARGFNRKETYAPTHVLSFGERAIEKMLKDDEARRELVSHNRAHLTRSYPSGKRVRSTNYLPNHFWAVGIQMASVNWQTFDQGMAMNMAMFARGGGTGYLLKPDILRRKGAVKDKEALGMLASYALDVEVISAQQLPRAHQSESSVIDPFVEVSLFVPGLASPLKRRTRIITGNVFNPEYNDSFNMPFSTHPSPGFLDLVFLRFDVLDARANKKAAIEEGKGDPLASYTISLGALQSGYRHTPLFDSFGNQLLFGSLFIRTDLTLLSTTTSHLAVPSTSIRSIPLTSTSSSISQRILDTPLASSPPSA